MIRRLIFLCVFFILTLPTISVSGQEVMEFGDGVIFTADNTSIYARPDETSDVVAIKPQGYVDRLGPAASHVGEWVFLTDQAGYVKPKDADLALRTNTLQQKLVDDVSAEITQNPDDPGLYTRRGTIYAYMREYRTSVEDYTKVITLAPNNAEAYALRGWVYRQIYQYDNSLADLQQAIDLGANDAWTLIALGVTYDRLKRYTDAELWFQQALDQYPEAIYAYIDLGVISYVQDNEMLAMRYYNQATELNPFVYFPYLLRANFYMDRGNTDAAIAELDRFIEINPYYPEAYLRLSRIYTYELRDPYTGLELVEKALTIEPQSSDAFLSRSMIYAYEIRNPEQAVEDLDTAIVLDPYNLSAIEEASAYYTRRGEFETALKFVQDRESIDCAFGRYNLLRAQLFYCMGDYQAVIDTLTYMLENETDSLRYSTDTTIALLFIGMASLQKGEYINATEYIQYAFAYTPEWTRDWADKYGVRYIDSRLILMAEYYQAIDDNPNKADNYLQLAHTLVEFGSWDEAILYYRQYLAMVENPQLANFVNMVQSNLDVIR